MTSRSILVFLTFFAIAISSHANNGTGNTGIKNPGNNNTGDFNTGNGNTGDANTGNNNNGSLNNGNDNSGHVNSGNGNTGDANSGNNNSGGLNSGNGNSGGANSGNDNVGDFNSGDNNVGDYNSGDNNIGDLNSGDNNIGNANSGDGNVGDFNAGNNNIGNGNAGNGNIGDNSAGVGNTGSGNVGNNNTGNSNIGNGNLGDSNFGHNNVGDSNFGDNNVGDTNFGDSNVGNSNSGSNNIGDNNSGNYNSGDGNLGNNNSGNNNFGNHNTGNSNSGHHNVGDDNFGSYNVGNSNQGNHNCGNNNFGNYNCGNNNNGNGNNGNGNNGNNNNGNGNNGNNNNGNNNNGNANNGNNNNGNNNVGNNHNGDNNEDEKDLFVDVVPLVFASYDRYTSIENLTIAKSKDNQITLDQYGNGFRLTKSFEYSLGLGAAAKFEFENAGDRYQHLGRVWGLIGLAPVKKSTLVMTRYIDEKEEAKELKIRIPFKASDLDDWKNQESISFENAGGIIFLVRAGYMGFSVGQTLVTQGKYKTIIEKKEGRRVVVELIQTDVHAATSSATAYLASLSLTFTKQAGENLRFQFDLNDPEAAAAYEAMLQGNLLPTQDIADNFLDPSVIRVEKGKFRTSERSFAFRVATPIIPVISVGAGQDKIQEFSHKQRNNDQTETDTHYGVYIKKSSSRLGFIRKETMSAFYGGLTNTTTLDKKKSQQRFMGRFVWKYHSSHNSTSKFLRAINNLQKQTNLEQFVGIEVENLKKLGYIRAELNLHYSEMFIKHLMKINNTVELDILEETALKKYESYFASNDPYKLCDELDLFGDDRNELCLVRYKYDIKNAFKKIRGALESMSESSLFTQGPKFTKGLSKIGQQLLRNRFIFNTFFEAGKKCGLGLQYKIIGERVSQYKKQQVWNATQECQL